MPAIEAIDEIEVGYIDDESDSESSDDEDEEDAESESEYEEEEDEEHDDDDSETTEVSYRPSASSRSRPESRWQMQRKSPDKKGLVIIRVPKSRLMAITKKNGHTQGPNQAERKDREDKKEEKLHSRDNVKVKQEVIVLSDDETPFETNVQGSESKSTSNRKRKSGEAEDAEIKRRKREKQKLQLQLQQLQVQQQLLEFDDVEE